MSDLSIFLRKKLPNISVIVDTAIEEISGYSHISDIPKKVYGYVDVSEKFLSFRWFLSLIYSQMSYDIISEFGYSDENLDHLMRKTINFLRKYSSIPDRVARNSLNVFKENLRNSFSVVEFGITEKFIIDEFYKLITKTNPKKANNIYDDAFETIPKNFLKTNGFFIDEKRMFDTETIKSLKSIEHRKPYEYLISVVVLLMINNFCKNLLREYFPLYEEFGDLIFDDNFSGNIVCRNACIEIYEKYSETCKEVIDDYISSKPSWPLILSSFHQTLIYESLSEHDKKSTILSKVYFPVSIEKFNNDFYYFLGFGKNKVSKISAYHKLDNNLKNSLFHFSSNDVDMVKTIFKKYHIKPVLIKGHSSSHEKLLSLHFNDFHVMDFITESLINKH